MLRPAPLNFFDTEQTPRANQKKQFADRGANRDRVVDRYFSDESASLSLTVSKYPARTSGSSESFLLQFCLINLNGVSASADAQVTGEQSYGS